MARFIFAVLLASLAFASAVPWDHHEEKPAPVVVLVHHHPAPAPAPAPAPEHHGLFDAVKTWAGKVKSKVAAVGHHAKDFWNKDQAWLNREKAYLKATMKHAVDEAKEGHFMEAVTDVGHAVGQELHHGKGILKTQVSELVKDVKGDKGDKGVHH